MPPGNQGWNKTKEENRCGGSPEYVRNVENLAVYSTQGVSGPMKRQRKMGGYRVEKNQKMELTDSAH